MCSCVVAAKRWRVACPPAASTRPQVWRRRTTGTASNPRSGAASPTASQQSPAAKSVHPDAAGLLVIWSVSAEPKDMGYGPAVCLTSTWRKCYPNEVEFDVLVDKLIVRESLPKNNRTLMRSLVGELELNCKQQWRECQVVPFGSYNYGLMMTDSDIDATIMLPKFDAKAVLDRMQMLVRSRPDLYYNVNYIHWIEDPVLTFKHRTYNIPFDMMVNAYREIQIGKLMKYLLNLDRRVFKFAFIVKHWAKIHNRASQRMLTNYGMTCLVIFYLQHKKMLPSIASLQRDHPDPQADSHSYSRWYWPHTFSRLPFKPQNDEPFNQLVGEFFTFYAEFDYNANVICPYLGYPIAKTAFDDTDRLPSEFKRYKLNMKMKLGKKLSMDLPIMIQDIFVHNDHVLNHQSTAADSSYMTLFNFAAQKYRQNNLTFLEEILKETSEELAEENIIVELEP